MLPGMRRRLRIRALDQQYQTELPQVRPIATKSRIGVAAVADAGDGSRPVTQSRPPTRWARRTSPASQHHDALPHTNTTPPASTVVDAVRG